MARGRFQGTCHDKPIDGVFALGNRGNRRDCPSAPAEVPLRFQVLPGFPPQQPRDGRNPRAGDAPTTGRPGPSRQTVFSNRVRLPRQLAVGIGFAAGTAHDRSGPVNRLHRRRRCQRSRHNNRRTHRSADGGTIGLARFCGALGALTWKSPALSPVSTVLPPVSPGLRSYPRSAFVEPRLASGVPSRNADPALKPTWSMMTSSGDGANNAMPPSSVMPVP